MAQPGLVDWSPIGELGDVYKKAQEQRQQDAFRQALGGLAQQGGPVDYGKLVSLAAQFGQPDVLLNAMHAQQQGQQFGQTQNVRQAQLDLAKQRQQFEEGTSGWSVGPNGQLTFKPGGPADPAYVQQLSEAKQKPREFSVTDVTKLSEEGGKYANITKFADTFEPRFAGYGMQSVGQGLMKAGRFLPEGVVGKDVAQGANWWQGYDRFKNVVRNELYGAALTANEQAAFEQADINPGMNPDQIKKNLAIQKDVAQNGLKRKANALIRSGYDPQAIGAAYGLNLSDLGLNVQSKRGGTAAATTQAATTPEYDHPAISEARTLIGQGRLTRANAEKKLRENNIPFKPGDLDLQ